MDKPKVGLVLGAGSARGLAHVGVLQVLEEQGIPFHFIVGSSMGAMIGGIYGSGTDIKILGKVFEQIDLGRFFEIGIPTMGFINGTKINEFLKLLTKNKRFEDLFLPVYMVATDLYTGTTVVINEGSVAEAIRASISIPGIFRPVPRGQMLLVDGAVTDRVPVEAAAQMGADIIIAVDVKFGAGKQIVINNTLDVILTSLDIMQRQQLDTICNTPGKNPILIERLADLSLLYGGRSDYNSCNDDIQSLSKQHQIDPCSISRRSSSLPEAMVSRVRCKTNSIWDRTCSAY
jgi:NTE family protein